MAEQQHDLRPEVEEFECLGGRVVIADARGILAAARAERVQILRTGIFPTPVRQVQFWVDGTSGPDGSLVVRIDLRTSRSAQDLIAVAMPGLAAPVGVVLARKLVASSPTASRLADRVASEADRLLGPPTYRDPATGTRVDAGTGLEATVTYEATTNPAVVVTAAGPLNPAQVGAMFRLVLGVVRDLSASSEPDAFRGQRYVLSLRPPTRTAGQDRTDTVTLDHVGGLDQVVSQFREIATSFQHPEIMARWGARRPQGLLLYGPPGTGKTMLARALANEIGATFREIRTPEILDKWLGGSERNIKRIFQEARRYREPTVMLFDEFDSIISYTGAGMDAASQAVNAVAGIFKQEMNNLIEDNPNVIVVATTNFPQRVDDSLIRSGRFDVKMSIPLPDEAGRAEIFAKMIGELIGRHEVSGFRMFADDVDPGRLGTLSHGMTGADIKEVLRRVQLAKAMEEARGGGARPISQDDLARGIAGLRG